MANADSINERAEARLEQLLEQHADVGSQWRDMVGSMQAEAGEVAVDAVSMATRPSVDELAVQALSERIDSLAERLEGVGMADIAQSLNAASRGLDASDSGSLARASEAALVASQDLSATAEMAKSFDPNEQIAVGQASEFAAAGEGKDYDYGYKHSSLLNAIDKFREGADLPPLREVSPLFRTIPELAQDLGRSWKDSHDSASNLESALADMGKAKSELDSLRESAQQGNSISSQLSAAEASFNKAESSLMSALDRVAADLQAPGMQKDSAGMTTAEATMTQFLEAGGVVTPELSQEVNSLNDLAGLTVKEMDGMDPAMFDAEAAKDLAGMLDNFAAQADSLGLSDMAEGLRDAASATAEGPDAVDLDSVRDFVGEAAATVSELNSATEAFSFGQSELSIDNSSMEQSDAGMVTTEVSMDSKEFSALFASAESEQASSQSQENSAEAEAEMSL